MSGLISMSGTDVGNRLTGLPGVDAVEGACLDLRWSRLRCLVLVRGQPCTEAEATRVVAALIVYTPISKKWPHGYMYPGNTASLSENRRLSRCGGTFCRIQANSGMTRQLRPGRALGHHPRKGCWSRMVPRRHLRIVVGTAPDFGRRFATSRPRPATTAPEYEPGCTETEAQSRPCTGNAGPG